MKDLLDLFSPISLEKMSSVRLMNRIDTKYVMSSALLSEFLSFAQEHYYVQEVNSERVTPYHTIYLDNSNFDMYMAHQDGKRNRYKVRMREYVHSNLSFVEVKHKDNHGRTHKNRIETDGMDYGESDELEFVNQYFPYDASKLFPSVENNFNRITLVNKAMTERLTIDMNLSFHNLRNDNCNKLENVVVIEVKRDGLQPSHAVEILKKLRVKPLGFSKMAIGMALTSPDIKQNLLKSRLHEISKISCAG